MGARIFTLIIAMFMVGIPWITSSTNYGYIREYQKWFDGPVAITAWIIWALWMVYPLTYYIQSNWHVRRDLKRIQKRQESLTE